MKAASVRIHFWACLLSAGLILIGSSCSSSKSGAEPKRAKLNPRTAPWNDYVGTYTFEEAVLDMGKPAMVEEGPDGRIAEWVLRRSPRVSFGFGVGGGSVGSHSAAGVGVGSTVSPPPHGENLRLKFGVEGKLMEWTKVTY